LAQSLCVVENDGELVLRRCTGGSAAGWTAGEIQHGSGGAVHIGGVYGLAVGQAIAISMDGRGKAQDNAYIERLWWTVMYENVYPKDYADGHALRRGFGRYFDYCNN
jgi:hypothetical protein